MCIRNLRSLARKEDSRYPHSEIDSGLGMRPRDLHFNKHRVDRGADAPETSFGKHWSNGKSFDLEQITQPLGGTIFPKQGVISASLP